MLYGDRAKGRLNMNFPLTNRKVTDELGERSSGDITNEYQVELETLWTTLSRCLPKNGRKKIRSQHDQGRGRNFFKGWWILEYICKQVVLKPQCALPSPAGLIKIQIAGPHLKSSESVGLGVGLKKLAFPTSSQVMIMQLLCRPKTSSILVVG